MQQTTEYQGPLAGLNVLDFGHYYAGPMAALLLADQGANVIRVMKPGEPELREQQFRLLNRNKKLLELDLQTKEGKIQALSLIERADVVIENFRPDVMKRLDLDYASVKETNPGLVYLSLPGFASTDKKRAQIQAWEGVVCAAAGLYTETNLFRQVLGFPPVYTWVPHCSAYGAMHGAMAVMAALISRDEHGRGAVIETPLVDAGLSGFTTGFAQGSFVLGGVAGTLRTTEDPNAELPDFLKPLVFTPEDSQDLQLEKLEQAHRDFLSRPLMRYYPCADGRPLLMWSGIKHYVVPILKKLGIYQQLREEGFVKGSVWEPGEHNLIVGLSPERTERLKQLIGDTLLTKNAEEWETLLADYGPVVMARTREEWLALEPMIESGVLTQMDNGQSKLTVPGRVVDMSGPTEEAAGALLTGFEEVEVVSFEQAARLWGVRQKNSEVVQTQKEFPESVKGGMLCRLKVLDMSSVLSGPTAGYTLAQYGAQVIKADQPDYMYFEKNALDVNQGKRSILNDMKTAEGREIFRRLVSWADVVLQNCLDDVAKRLGVSHEQLQAINPNIVSCQVSAFGGTLRGHWETRPGFDPVACAATSLTTHYGTRENPQSHGSTSCGDIMGGLALAYSALLGVYQQRKTGYGGEGRTSLARANNYIQLPYIIAENGNSNWGEDHGQFAVGDHWWQRMYQCLDGWIYVGADEKCANMLVEAVIGQQVVDEQSLEDAFLKRDCAHWAEELQRVGIGCHRVLTIGDICATGVQRISNEASDETVTGALEVLRWEEHPCGSPVILPAPTWVRIGEHNSYKRLSPGPRLGEHTKEILQELGYEKSEIAELIRLKIAHEYMTELGSKDAYFFDQRSNH